ncbi:MAG: SRPBCC domain-containing protein [Actinomycetota bacterium]|nr:SRPBCC domain-containing protein [Actinomycetota bacterium]
MTKEIWIDAPPELVFPYLVQPDLATAWMGDESWNNPLPGGVFRLNIRGNVASGEFVALDPPRRVVYTWGWEGEGQIHPPGSTTVEFELEPESGGTRVRLRHTGLTERGVELHGQGWDQFLPELAKAAA